MLGFVKSAALGLLLLACTSCALNGVYTHDEIIIQQDIVATCVVSGAFVAVDTAVGAVMGAAFPIGALPNALVKAGVAIVCAQPAVYAAIDAGTADWIYDGVSPTVAWLKKNFRM